MLCCRARLPSSSRWPICSCATEQTLPWHQLGLPWVEQGTLLQEACCGCLNQKGSGGTLLGGTIRRAQPGWLTVRCPRSKVIGCLCHVLRQQLPVGDPGGHLAVEFLVEEFFYSGTWNEDATSGYRKEGEGGARGTGFHSGPPPAVPSHALGSKQQHWEKTSPPSGHLPILPRPQEHGQAVQGSSRSPFSHKGMKDGPHKDALHPAPTNRAFCQRTRLSAEIRAMFVLQELRFGLTGVWL